MEYIIPAGIVFVLLLTWFFIYAWNYIKKAEQDLDVIQRQPQETNTSIRRRRTDDEISRRVRPVLAQMKQKARALDTDPFNITTKIDLNWIRKAREQANRDMQTEGFYQTLYSSYPN